MSEWEYYYLKIWKEDTDKCDISANSILGKLGVQDVPIFKLYFLPFNGRMSLSVFLEFIVLFSFFTIEQLLPLLYSVIRVKSNRVITEDQVFELLHNIKATPESYQTVGEWLADIKRDDNGFIPLSELTTLLLNEPTILYILNELKTKIIESIITFELYLSIRKKKQFFDENSLTNIQPPKEKCMTYVLRVLFSHYPPPYYCTYTPYIHRVNIEDILYTIRQRFGYSKRPTCAESSLHLHSSISRNSLKLQKSLVSHERSKSKRLSSREYRNNNNLDISINRSLLNNSKIVPVM